MAFLPTTVKEARQRGWDSVDVVLFTGAMLITKSGDKIAKFFGISKYTLYSYLDTSNTGAQES